MNQEDTKQDVLLAALSRDIHHMSNSVSEIKQTMTTVMGTYVSRAELQAVISAQMKLHEDIEKRFEAINSANGKIENKVIEFDTKLKIWLSVAAVGIGIVQSIITAIIINILV